MKKAFSLAEMMVVMLVLTLVLAAATPIITKRAVQPVKAGITGASVTPIVNCSSDSGTQNKEITLSGVSLVNGSTIFVRFANKNTFPTPSLKVNGIVGSIYSEGGQQVSATNPAYFPAGAVVEFLYDGSNWIFKRRIVESYINGPKWYKIYSDGWIEQGGQITGTGSFATSFWKEFSDTNYTIQMTAQMVTTGAIAGSTVGVKDMTPSAFTCERQPAYGNNISFWVAFGY